MVGQKIYSVVPDFLRDFSQLENEMTEKIWRWLYTS